MKACLNLTTHLQVRASQTPNLWANVKSGRRVDTVQGRLRVLIIWTRIAMPHVIIVKVILTVLVFCLTPRYRWISIQEFSSKLHSLIQFYSSIKIPSFFSFQPNVKDVETAWWKLFCLQCARRDYLTDTAFVDDAFALQLVLYIPKKIKSELNINK